MALVGSINYEQLSHITKKYYVPQLVDNIFRGNVVTYRLLAKSQPISGGYKVVQPVEYAKTPSGSSNPHVDWYKGDDEMNYGASDIIKSAEYDWSQHHGTITMSGREENINAGPEAVLDLLQAKVNNVGRTMRDKFAEAIFSDNSQDASSGHSVDADAFTGIQHVIKSDRVLGGINSAAAGNEFWDGGFDGDAADFGGTDNTKLTFTKLTTATDAAYIQKIFRDLYQRLTVGGDSPTMLVCSQVVFDAYEQTLTDQKRYGASSAALADAGFQNLLYRGIPVVVDQALDLYNDAADDVNASDGNRMLFALNEKYMGFKHHAKRNFIFDGYEKPVDRDIRVGKILWMGALCYSNPRMIGGVADMPTSYS